MTLGWPRVMPLIIYNQSWQQNYNFYEASHNVVHLPGKNQEHWNRSWPRSDNWSIDSYILGSSLLPCRGHPSRRVCVISDGDGAVASPPTAKSPPGWCSLRRMASWWQRVHGRWWLILMCIMCILIMSYSTHSV